MKQLSRMFFLFFTTSLLLFSCKPKQDVLIKPVVKADIALTDVTSNGCLNLEKLSAIFLNSEFSAPASVMTTNLKPLEELSSNKTRYFAYATFNYKTLNANELGLFSQTRQKDCKNVQMLSASEEILNFQIVSSSEDEVTIKLLDKFKDKLTTAHKKALFDRQQPYEITYKFVSPTHMIITEKYRTVDPICTNKNTLSFEIRKEVNWASYPNDLPQSYAIDSQYLTLVKESIPADPTVNPSALETPESISVSSILAVMKTPVKEELKLCIQ
jgi:hypothetical protein